MSDRYDLPVKNIKAVFMQKSLLVIGLLFCLPSLPAQAQIRDMDPSATLWFGCV